MAVTNVRDIDLGLYLKIVSRGAVYNTLNKESAMWDNFARKLKADAEQGGEVRWNMRKSYGAASVQFVPTTAGAFPKGQKSTMKEGIGYYKDVSLAIEVPITLLRKAEKDPGRYGKPIAEEVEAKGIAAARLLSSSLTQDGLGIIGEVSTATYDLTANTVTVKLKTTTASRSHVGWFFEEDKLIVARDNTGEQKATINASGTPATPDYWLVVDIDRANDNVTLKPYDSSDVALDISAAASSTDLKANDLIRRYGSLYVNPAGSITDYGTQTYQWCGLESLAAADGRVVNNVTMSGALKGTRFDCGGDLIEPQDIQQALSQVKSRVGQQTYKYKSAYMAPETYDAMIDEREGDRRFNVATDNARGTASMKYIHRKDNVEFETDDFVKKNRVFICPEGDALVYLGSDFDYVRPEGGSAWSFKPNSSGSYNREMVAFMEGCGLFYAQHSAAVCVLENFTLS
jgi:hypothetical protein